MTSQHWCKAKRIDFENCSESLQWAEGYFVKTEDRCFLITVMMDPVFYEQLNINTFVEVIPETISRPTGLMDKNLTPIWENDIVRVPYRNLEDSYCRIVFKNGQFIGVEQDGCENIIRKQDIEIIGNAFDNPELLLDSKNQESDNLGLE